MKNISEVPEKALNALYEARPLDLLNTPFDAFIKNYGLIAINGELYTNDECLYLAKRCQEAKDSNDNGRWFRFPHAIIVDDDKILKNRYGYTTF